MSKSRNKPSKEKKKPKGKKKKKVVSDSVMSSYLQQMNNGRRLPHV